MKESVLPLDGQTAGENEFNENGSEGTLCSKYFEESLMIKGITSFSTGVSKSTISVS